MRNNPQGGTTPVVPRPRNIKNILNKNITVATWEFEGTPEYVVACYSLLPKAPLRVVSNMGPTLQKKERTEPRSPVLQVKAEVIEL